jgi:multisubunit Na+/H+ antiporter MnhE subunit
MFRSIWSTLVGLLIEDGQLAIGALVALAITWAIASSLGDQGRDASGWVLLAIVLALVVANIYRAGVSVRARMSSMRR